MKVLVINCGSSSLKYQLIDSQTEEVLAKGLCERIGIDGSKLTHKPTGKEDYVVESPMKDHQIAVKLVLDALTDKDHGVIADIKEISAVGHRVLHAGQVYSDSIVVNEDVKKVIRECFDLGPLHNPANLIGIEACEAAMPGVPQVAVFDTAFGQSMPRKAYLYAIPYEYYEKYGIRRYGFHGTSHSFVSKETIKFANLDPENCKVIVCHLGNGASISASIGGKCVDTSMGLTPLEGLIMGTRSGDVDPAVVQYICNKENKTVDEVLNILNKKSGVLGISGVSSDFRDITKAENEGNERAKAANEAFIYRVIKYIGAYVAAMNGVDAIAFTAGVGENDVNAREKILSGLTPLEGLIMGTRSGDVDPAVVQYICNKENKTVDEVLNILNKKSGVLGISGVSSDFRDITKAENEGNERAKAANEAFIYRVIKYIGAYVAAMNGVDAIAFTAGVGENDVNAREKILSGLTYLGIEVDHEANKRRGENTMISTPASKVKVAVIPTNEELAIARETVALV